jgi:hypothetical protein
MNRNRTTLLSFLAALAVAPAASAAIVAPDHLHLCARAPGEVVETSVWLINTDDAPLDVLTARASCGCTTLAGFAPQTLAPRSAVEVPIRVTAPKESGATKAVAVTFTIGNGDTIRAPIRIETAGTPAVASAVTVSPPELDLGRVTAATEARATIRLTNPGHAPIRVTAAKAGCGCITFPGFAPLYLNAGASADVRLSVKAPGTVGGAVTRDVTFIVDGHPPVRLSVRLEVVHPSVEALRRCLAPPAPDATGPRYGDFRVDGDVVSAVVWSADTSPAAYLVCRLDGEGRIRSLSVEPISSS